jgi:hypothetical protein
VYITGSLNCYSVTFYTVILYKNALVVSKLVNSALLAKLFPNSLLDIPAYLNLHRYSEKGARVLICVSRK